MALFLLAALAVVLPMTAAENCFSANPPYLNKVFNLPDTTGNYSVVTEYWMKLDSECDFVVDTNTRMTWYSSDIFVDT
eukprot:CAMPEP_0170480780 /NCGR_PEP_ID=MMETSP0208-20121228/1483_1 /TAXON_ID=197538 /ORGANISM="Strombidium inclinatum, Strain S3" /LENGTH=77 /DNA_ID=CAMNT_0010753377 /DNA_START=23 /DNA_END=256 /DNA_ORIENTATION=-